MPAWATIPVPWMCWIDGHQCIIAGLAHCAQGQHRGVCLEVSPTTTGLLHQEQKVLVGEGALSVSTLCCVGVLSISKRRG